MATNNNGHGDNGAGGPSFVIRTKGDPLALLRRLMEYHEERVRAYLMVLEDVKRAESRHRLTATKIAEAIAIDGARRQQHTRKRRTGASQLDRRAKAAAFLATLKPGQTYLPEEISGALPRPGVYISNGYLKRKGKLYVRTAKPFTAEKPTAAA